MTQPKPRALTRLALGLVATLLAAPVAAVPVTITQVGTYSGNPGSGNASAQMNLGNKFVMRTTYDAAATPAAIRTINGLDFRVIDLATRVAPADPFTGQGGLVGNGNGFELLIPMEGFDTATPFVYSQNELNHLSFPGFNNDTPQILFTAVQTSNPGDPNNLPPVTDPGLSAPGAPDFVGFEFEGDFPVPFQPIFGSLLTEVAAVDIGGGVIERTATFGARVFDATFDPAISTTLRPDDPPGSRAVVLAQDVVAEAGANIVYDAGNLTRTTDASSQNNNLGNARTDAEDFVTYSWTGPGGGALGGTDADGTEQDVIPVPGLPALIDNPVTAPRTVENVNKTVGIVDSGLTRTTDVVQWQVEVTEDLTGLGPSTDTTDVSYANAGPTANAGPPLVYDAATLAALADGSVADPDLAVNALIPGFESHTFQWSQGGNPLGTTEDVLVTIQDSGLTTTIDTSVLDFTVTDFAGASDTASTGASYSNALPVITTASATPQGADLLFEFAFDDPDLAVNSLIAAFELLDVQILVDAVDQTGFFTGLIAGGSQLVSNADLVSQFGLGLHSFEGRVTDRAGALATAVFQFDVLQQQQVPAPATAALLALGLAGVLGGARRRRPEIH